MTKVSRKPITSEDLNGYLNNLWSAFLLSSSKEQVQLLFKDLYTHTEGKMAAKRFEIARRLLRKESYATIMRELNVTEHTISNVSNTLAEQGEGFRKAHQNLEYLEQKELRKQQKRTKRLENPFSGKLHRKTLLGEALKVGVRYADKKLIEQSKQKSAYHKLSS